MMNNEKKVLTISLYGNNNYGNKLQSYALHYYINKNFNLVKIVNQKIEYYSKILLKRVLKKIYYFVKRKKTFNKRTNNFIMFTSNNFIETSRVISNYSVLQKKINNFDYYIYGSDQIWNPYSSGTSRLYLGYLSNNNVSYAASFGVDEIPKAKIKKYKKGLKNFKYISVREDRGKEIVEELTGRKDVEVLVDPTMLLTAKEWDNVAKKPKQLKSKKYILNYFLGELSDERKKEIERIAKENNCDIINIMDKKDPLYVSGPSEFLYLEKNAFLICTDSFHSCVFALLYNRPFVVFDREQEGIENMNSRMDTLINKFKLKNRRFSGKITKENLKHDYSEAYKILEKERKKSDDFLRKALDLDK